MGSPSQRIDILLVFGVMAVAAVVLSVFWEFTADDAYIYMRYGANLADTGALVFNQGERVSTMTSPLLALLDSLLYAVTGDPRTAYKVLGVVLLAATTSLVLRCQPRDALLRSVAAAVVLLPPSVLLWTVGGMETSLHMFLVTVVAFLALGCGPDRPGRAHAVLFLAGLTFVCRQDSVPFMAGVCLYALAGQRPRDVAVALLAGAALPVAWSVFSLWYYEDLFPTSVYVKPPLSDLSVLAANAAYIGEFLVYTGLLPLAIWVAVEIRRSGHALPGIGRRPWGAWLGLVLQLGYALTMATVHMMFAFRALVPYLPAAVLLVGVAASRAQLPARGRVGSSVLAFGLLAIVALQIVQVTQTTQRSIQGLARNGELQRAPLEDFTSNLEAAERLIRDVEAHWTGLDDRPREHPRIWTWAEGIMPYTYRDAHFFGSLISYRHHDKHSIMELQGWSDYVITPGPAGVALPGEVASQPVVFNGNSGRIVAIYNAEPLSFELPDTVGGQSPR